MWRTCAGGCGQGCVLHAYYYFLVFTGTVAHSPKSAACLAILVVRHFVRHSVFEVAQVAHLIFGVCSCPCPDLWAGAGCAGIPLAVLSAGVPLCHWLTVSLSSVRQPSRPALHSPLLVGCAGAPVVHTAAIHCPQHSRHHLPPSAQPSSVRQLCRLHRQVCRFLRCAGAPQTGKTPVPLRHRGVECCNAAF